MLYSAVVFSGLLLVVQARANGLLGGSLIPKASLDIFKSSSLKGLSNPEANKQTTQTTRPSCTGTSSLLSGQCLPATGTLQQASDTLDTLNIKGQIGVPLTPLEAQAGLSLNPAKINASADIIKKEEPGHHEGLVTDQDKESDIPNRLSDESQCLQTVTVVNGKPSCKDRLVFEDTFDSLDPRKWQHVVQFAGDPDFEFVVYSNDKRNSYVSNRKLHIKPTLLADDGTDINTGMLELEGCTGTEGTLQCKKTAIGRNILPPIKSARLTTKNSFNFQYGHIEVQAKLPSGDWIFPEIWLEPKSNTYGSKMYESGLIEVALARGNRNLVANEKDIGARHLTASCMLGIGPVTHSESFNVENVGQWTNDFHTYGVTWTPENITFRVDGKVIGSVNPPAEGFKKLEKFSDLQVPWARGSKIAPYDQEFFISIGAGVGGFRLFPDDSLSSGHVKPWKNRNVKAMLSFWKDKDNWFPSWSGDSSLQVEHVKVWAL